MKGIEFEGPEGQELGAELEAIWLTHPNPRPFQIESEKGASWARVGFDLNHFLDPIQAWVTGTHEEEENGRKMKTIFAEVFPLRGRK